MRTARTSLLTLALALAATTLPCGEAAAAAPETTPPTILSQEALMPTYSPAGHARLAAEAAALAPAVLEAYADEAEALFGIAGTTYADTPAAELTLAVVRQINLTVRLEQHGGGALWSESSGDQSVNLARDAKSGRPVVVDQIAQQIVTRVLATPPGESPVAEPPLASSASRIEFTW